MKNSIVNFVKKSADFLNFQDVALTQQEQEVVKGGDDWVGIEDVILT